MSGGQTRRRWRLVGAAWLQVATTFLGDGSETPSLSCGARRAAPSRLRTQPDELMAASHACACRQEQDATRCNDDAARAMTCQCCCVPFAERCVPHSLLSVAAITSHSHLQQWGGQLRAVVLGAVVLGAGVVWRRGRPRWRKGGGRRRRRRRAVAGDSPLLEQLVQPLLLLVRPGEGGQGGLEKVSKRRGCVRGGRRGEGGRRGGEGVAAADAARGRATPRTTWCRCASASSPPPPPASASACERRAASARRCRPRVPSSSHRAAAAPRASAAAAPPSPRRRRRRRRRSTARPCRRASPPPRRPSPRCAASCYSARRAAGRRPRRPPPGARPGRPSRARRARGRA